MHDQPEHNDITTADYAHKHNVPSLIATWLGIFNASKRD